MTYQNNFCFYSCTKYINLSTSMTHVYLCLFSKTFKAQIHKLFFHHHSSPDWTKLPVSQHAASPQCNLSSCKHTVNPDSNVHSDIQETVVMALRGAHDCCSSNLKLCDQDVCDASEHSHKVKHIPGCLQVVLKDKRCIERSGNSFKL